MTEGRKRFNEGRNRLKRKHFSSEAWSDFVRNAGDKKRLQTMRQHLLQGCRNCRDQMELWKAVATAAERQAQYQPPAWLLRSERGRFGLLRALPEMPGVLPFARMIFNSLQQPVTAGVRSTGRKARHAVFQVGSYLVDVRMENEPGSKQMTLIGQVRDSAEPKRDMGNNPVVLLNGPERIGRTTTNPYGEFCLECAKGGNFWLAVGIKGEPGIVVSLERVVAAEAAAVGR